MKDLDIFENLKIIEMLKSNILKNISALYENMTMNNERKKISKEDVFSELLINVYILSMRLDIDIDKIEKRAVDRMRLKLLDENSSLKNNYNELCAHFRK